MDAPNWLKCAKIHIQTMTTFGKCAKIYIKTMTTFGNMTLLRWNN